MVGGFQNNGSVSAVAAGFALTCAIESGIAYCWGANGLGAVGNGVSTTPQIPHPNVPQKVVNNDGFINAGVTAVAAGATTCAIKGGELFCWGVGEQGQMGNGTLTRVNPRPVKVGATTDGQSNSNWTSVSVAGLTVCGVRNLTMYCWGGGGYGNLGVGQQVSQQTTPRSVSMAGGLTNISITSHHAGEASCAVEAGIVYCVGRNSTGQVGDGTTTTRLLATKVSAGGGMTNNGSVTMVSTRDGHACALENGSAYCWGNAANGRLGNGTTTPNRFVPVAAASLPWARAAIS